MTAANASTVVTAMMTMMRREADGEAGLQDQPVERDQAEPVIAAAGQAALAPQLDQHAFPVGAVLRIISRRLIRLRYEAVEKHNR